MSDYTLEFEQPLHEIVEKIDANINTIATWLTAANKAYRKCLQDQGAI